MIKLHSTYQAHYQNNTKLDHFRPYTLQTCAQTVFLGTQSRIFFEAEIEGVKLGKTHKSSLFQEGI